MLSAPGTLVHPVMLHTALQPRPHDSQTAFVSDRFRLTAGISGPPVPPATEMFDQPEHGEEASTLAGHDGESEGWSAAQQRVFSGVDLLGGAASILGKRAALQMLPAAHAGYLSLLPPTSSPPASLSPPMALSDVVLQLRNGCTCPAVEVRAALTQTYSFSVKLRRFKDPNDPDGAGRVLMSIGEAAPNRQYAVLVG